VLWVINVVDIWNVKKNRDYSGVKEYFCFDTKDELQKEWKVCNANEEIRNKWYCNIKKRLKQEDAMCWWIPKDPNVTVIEKKNQKAYHYGATPIPNV